MTDACAGWLRHCTSCGVAFQASARCLEESTSNQTKLPCCRAVLTGMLTNCNGRLKVGLGKRK
jgi:hypothetical protein